MDSGAIVKMDIRVYVGILLWGSTLSRVQDPCPFGLPEMLTVAHINKCVLHSGSKAQDKGDSRKHGL